MPDSSILALQRMLCLKAVLGISIVGQLTDSVESSFLNHQDVYHDLFVCP